VTYFKVLTRIHLERLKKTRKITVNIVSRVTEIGVSGGLF